MAQNLGPKEAQVKALREAREDRRALPPKAVFDGKVSSDQALFQLALKKGKLGSPSEHMHKLAKRLNKGGRPSKHSDEPWKQQGVSRRTFYRRQAK
jgi:hypothetical protein